MKKRRIIVLVVMLSIGIILGVAITGKRKGYKYQNVKLNNVIVYTGLDYSLDDAFVYQFKDNDLWVLSGKMLLDQNNYPMPIYDQGNINLQVEDQQKFSITDENRDYIEKYAEKILNNRKYEEFLAERWSSYDGRHYGIYINGVDYFAHEDSDIKKLVDYIMNLSESSENETDKESGDLLTESPKEE